MHSSLEHRTAELDIGTLSRSGAPVETAVPTTPTAGGFATLPLVVTDLGFEVRGNRLIDGMSFSLTAGPCTIVLGPNGSGKSLLLRLCHGLIAPTSGAIRWASMVPAQAQRWHSMVFQRPVHLRRSAAGNIAYALGVKGVPRRKRKALIAEALEQTGLSELADRPARVLSGGEQQRLAIARILALHPEVVFFDEPTANLDPAATRAIEALIRAIDMSGTKVIMTTHDLAQARRLADDILFVHRGRLLEHMPASEFFLRPHNKEAAAFIRGELI